MGVQKKTRKFAEVKRVIGKNDARRKENLKKAEEAVEKAKRERRGADGEVVREIPQVPSHMFFQHNEALVPPYSVLVDTSFFSRLQAELEKLGPKFRIPLRVARDERWQRAKCDHKGTYGDDCLISRVQKDKIYIVATNDRGLQQRIRKIPGVPSEWPRGPSPSGGHTLTDSTVMKCARGKYLIERLPGAPE
ncbi:rRNA-processing protein fcf1 [Colletotrichum tropicale]|nr:rRNA-processing protein fcf1 [Colletotrichum tropicale]